MACTNTESCELYAQFASHPALRVWQTHYCSGDYKRCARFQLSLQKQMVPLNLLPNGSTIAVARSEEAYVATALFNAVLKNRPHMVGSLLRTGLDVNARSTNGATALMVAARIGNPETIRALLSNGADSALRNTRDETALDIAVRGGHEEAARILGSWHTASGKHRVLAQAPGHAATEKETETAFEASTHFLARLLSRLGLKPSVANSVVNVGRQS